MIILVITVLIIVSFILAYRSLDELEVPLKIIRGIENSVKTVKSWGTIIFLKNKSIHYSSKDKDRANENENLMN